MPSAAIAERPLIEQAQALAAAGDLDGALSCYEQVIAGGNAPVDVAVRAAEVAMTARRFDVAERYYAAVVDAVPDNPIIRLNHSYSLHRLNRFTEALDEVAVACELAPDMTAAQTFLGRLSHMLNQYDEAADAFERATQLEPEDGRVWLNFGEALIASYGRFEEGAAALAKAARLGAKDQDLLIAVANSQIGTGQYADAEALLRKILACLSGLHPHPLGLEWAQTGYRGARHGCSRPRRSPIPAFATRVPATFPR